MAVERDTAIARLRGHLVGVRARTTLAAVLVVGIALVAGAAVLLALLRSALLDDLRSDTALRAAEIAAGLEAGQRPPVVADPPGNDEDDGPIVQVLGRQGEVLATTAGAEGLSALARIEPGEAQRVDVDEDDEQLLAVAVPVTTARGELTVIVARSTEEVLESVEVARGLLTVSVPVLLVLVGATTWVVAGRALRPVEAIRAGAEQISSTALHRRVPDPRGRDEIARLASTMNRMLARLEDGQTRQRRFVAEASHELRSPVASLRQHAEVAQAHPDRSSVAGLAHTVLAESVRLQDLVDDLLLLARTDEHSLQLHRRPVDVDDLVLDEIRRRTAVTNHHVDGSGVSAARVLGDETSLARALRNLGDNAARHARSTVAYGLFQADGVAHLTVEDDGAGIPEGERARVFERFVRLDESRARDDGGTGLGLAVAKELVAAHGGEMAAEASTTLGGARIEVRLPAAHDPES